MTQCYRQEAEALVAFVEKDAVLVGQAETLRTRVEGKKPDEILAALADIEEGVAAITQTLAERRIMTL
jgi:hypothetical protein